MARRIKSERLLTKSTTPPPKIAPPRVIEQARKFIQARKSQEK